MNATKTPAGRASRIVHIRLPATLAARVAAAHAAGPGLTVSETVRRALAAGLDAADRNAQQ